MLSKREFRVAFRCRAARRPHVKVDGGCPSDGGIARGWGGYCLTGRHVRLRFSWLVQLKYGYVCASDRSDTNRSGAWIRVIGKAQGRATGRRAVSWCISQARHTPNVWRPNRRRGLTAKPGNPNRAYWQGIHRSVLASAARRNLDNDRHARCELVSPVAGASCPRTAPYSSGRHRR
jgi:hypothetical protein